MIRVVAEPNATSVNIYFPGGATERWYDINSNYSIERGIGYKSVNVTLDAVYRRNKNILKSFLTSNFVFLDSHLL